MLERPNWLSGWSLAKEEHSVRGVGKFDIALLSSEAASRKQARASDLVGVVEIIHKSPMTEEKVQELNRLKVCHSARAPPGRDLLTLSHADSLD